MSCRILAIFAISITIISSVANCAPVLVRTAQFLPPLPGYIPVYIRHGDTPLEDVNPDLAEAFDSYDRFARFGYRRSLKDLTTKDSADINDISLVQISDDNDGTVNFQEPSILTTSQHIQKIPKKPAVNSE